jgi:predicted RNA-binding Zn ribbon-like protein
MSTPRYGAPPELEPLRTFINSVNPEDSDPLTGPDELEAWCAQSELCRGAQQGDLPRLRAFREALREVLEVNSGTREASLAWASVEPFARAASYGMRIDATGPPALEPAGQGAERTIAALLAIVYDAMRRGTWSRLKACNKPSCRWAYYDRSKNGSGAWCSMAVCGNRMKASRRRQKSRISEP